MLLALSLLINGLDLRKFLVGVRDLVACGSFIPGGASQRMGGSSSNVSVSHVVRLRLSWTQVSHL